MLSRVGLVLVLWLTLAGAAQAQTTIHVTRTDDRVGGTCLPSDCTLREAITAAQPGDTVQLGPQQYPVTQGTHLLVDKAITIAGDGPGTTEIDGAGNIDTFSRPNRIMRVNAAVTIRDLSFTHGRDGNDENFVGCSPCSTINANGGGAIFNAGQLTLARVRFAANENSPTGGAIGNNGTLALTDVEFHDNSAAFGGAVFSRGGSVTATGVTIDANRGSSRGGAIYVLGGTMEVTNATVTGNGQSNTIAGGIANAGGNLTLSNVTIADNIRGGLMREAGVTSVENSILASGCVPAGQFGTVVAVSQDLGHNLDEDDTCGLSAATKVIGPARLAPVNANGGATPTMALLSGSAAFDRVPVQDCVPADQRGVQRDGLCDIGAFEAQRLDEPTVTTGDADEIGDGSARLSGTVSLAGEPGKLSFEWDVDPAMSSPVQSTGVGLLAGNPVERGEVVFGFPSGTQIYYRALAENASGVVRGAVRSFTTLHAPPSIHDLHRVDVGDESVTLRFVVDPGGPGAGYRIKVNDDDPPLVPLPGPATGPREITRTISNLAPDTDYRLRVEVANDDHTTASDDGIIDLRTLKRLTGTPGAALTVSEECPGPGRIAWGDGGTSPLVCADGTFTAAHTYAAAGRHRVKLTFDDGSKSELVALIEPGPNQRLLSVNVAGMGRVIGNGIDCPGVCSVALPVGASVALSATPGESETFHGWGGFCQGTDACAFELSDDASVTADFSGVVDPPGLGELFVSDITGTSARVGFLIDPNGVLTSYRLIVNGTELAPVSVGAGTGSTPIEHPLSGLVPDRRYEVQVIASNSAGDVSEAIDFTTLSAAPTIDGLRVVDASDESVTLRFVVDPAGQARGFRIRINDDDPPLAPLPGPATGPREITRTVSHLAPNTFYKLQVEASNDDQTATAGIDARTLKRFTGTPGAAVGVSEECPGPGQIAWGDGGTSPLVCANGTFTATHTYAAPARHRVKLTFDDGSTGELVTLIEPGADQRLLSVNVAGKGRVTGNGIDCPGVCSVALPADANVALTAIPANGEQFNGWGDRCNGTGACAFELSDHMRVTADFSGRVERPGLAGLDVTDVTDTTARLGFVVYPDGMPASYRVIVNGSPAAPVPVAASSGPVTIGRVLSGLVPDRRYEVQVIASNSAGEVSDAIVFTTAKRVVVPTPTAAATPPPLPIATTVPTPAPSPAPTPPPPPPAATTAVDVLAAPTRGTILVKLPRTNRFVTLTAGQELPYGTEVDARKGRVKLTAIPKAGAAPQTAEFYDGLFKLSYVGGITNLTLSEPLAACPKKGKRASAAQKQKKAKSRKLWGKGKGSFRTTGKYSAATVRGTTWLVQDTCAGTLTRVKQGVVAVRHGKKTVIVRAGKKYLAKARR